MTDLLQIRDLTVEYKTRRGTARAVDAVSLTVEENKTLGLAGESGCGKSTLGRAIIGLVPMPGRIIAGDIIFDLDEDLPYGEDRVVKGGQVNLAQLDTPQLRALRGRKIAYIFQDPMTSLNPMMTIGKHFTQLIRTHNRKASKEDALESAGDILEALGILPERLGDYPHQFSGGMRQRVMIGLALALQPRLLIADEPTTSLDVIVEAQILEQVAQLKKKFNLTTILMTHNLGVLAEVADSIAIMYCGRLMEVASTEALFAEPQHPYAQALLRSVPDVTKPEKKLTGIPGAPPDLVNPISGCMFRPRCPHAMKICVSKVPPLFRSQTKGLVACHLYKEAKK